jgi:hypothetical protein
VLEKPAARDPLAKPEEDDYASAGDYLTALQAWRESTGQRSAYEERQEARIDRLSAGADKARGESAARFNRSQDIGRRFELGQPILVGHHSEAGARRDQQRMDDNMRASVVAQRRAEDLERQAEAAAANRAISADDEDALVKLKARIEDLETLQARMKAINTAHARFLKDPSSLDRADLSDAEKARVRTFQPVYRSEPHPIPPYEFSNNSANIRRLKARLEEVSRLRAQAESAGAETATPFTGGRLEHNTELNRVQIFFDRKPEESVRDTLKRNGFRWAPSQGAWQRQATANGLAAAKQTLRDLGLLAKALPRLRSVTVTRRVA